MQSIIVIIGAYSCGFYFTEIFHQPTSFVGGLWAVISGIIVFEITAMGTLQSAKTRIIGTFTGAFISGVYLILFSFSIIGYGITIAIGILICYAFKIQNSLKLTSITISVVLIVSTIENELHPFMNAGLRFAESAIGIGIALLVAFSSHYLDKATFKKDKLE